MEDAEMVNVQDVPSEDGFTGEYTWEIKNLSKITDPKHYSERFEVGTYFWRLLLFPRGNKVNMVSIYLDAPEAPYTPLHMSPKAKFKLVLYNQKDPSKSHAKESSHTFTAQEADWGFTQFIALDELTGDKGFVVNDTIIIKCYIGIQKDERYSYDSRVETGFVGLKNQGATCYMNSLLQYLFMIPSFRRAVYHMPTSETDEPSKSLPLALQSVFYKLQYSQTAVSTKDLTKSFGWGTYDAFMQHDVQELNRVLCEKLEEKMKGTTVEKVINHLFEGYTINYVKCVNVAYESSRKESYMDLQLDVKGCKDIYASFDKYVEEEMLNGQNQYKAEGHGLQDAKKGVLFESFPPVLQLQLKRFEYDCMQDMMVKINDHYEFYEELDLDVGDHKYLSPNADKSVRNLYRLHSVLVHSGGVHGGHYYAYSTPNGTKWLKFDDERVTLEDKTNAMNEQFGETIEAGMEDDTLPAPGYDHAPPTKLTKNSSAYMLVYVRVSEWSRIMCDVTKEDIAQHLRTRLEAEQKEKEERQQQKSEAHMFCTLRVATDEDIKSQVGQSQHFDLVNHNNVKSYRIRKQTKFVDFKAQIAEELGVPVELQRYWTWSSRQNQTFRPVKPLTQAEESQCLMDLREFRDQSGPLNKHALMDVKLYLELPTKSGKLHELSKSDILLFFKRYDPATEELRYVGKLFVHKQTRLNELLPILVKMGGFEEGAQLDMFEEIKFEPTVMVERLDMKVSAEKAQLEDGDIICFQRAMSESQSTQFRHPFVKGFLEYTRARKVVTFHKLDDPKDPGLRLELLKDMDYDQVTNALADKLAVDAAHIRLTQQSAYSHQPLRTPVKFRCYNRLEAMLSPTNHPTDVLYYEVLDMPLEKLEQLKTLRIAFHNAKAEFVRECTLSLPPNCLVGSALEELRKLLGSDYQTQTLRLLTVLNSRIYKVLHNSDSIDNINDLYWQLRAEVHTPEDQAALTTADPATRLMHVAHFQVDKDNSAHLRNFGEPFLMTVHSSMTVADLRQQIQAKLAIAPEEFSTWKLALVSQRASPEYQPDFYTDKDLVFSKFSRTTPSVGTEQDYLGLMHEDKGPKRPAFNSRYTYERPVKIFA